MSYDLSLDIERITAIVKKVPPICSARPWWIEFQPPDRIELWLRAGLSESGSGARARTHDASARARAREEAARARRGSGTSEARGRETLARIRARDYVIASGAALFNLRLAIRVAGHDLVVRLLPDPAYADPMRPPALLAVVEIVTSRVRKPSISEQELYEAIERPHASRQPYPILPVPLPVVTEMEGAAAQEGAYLRLLSPREAKTWIRRTAGAVHGPASPGRPAGKGHQAARTDVKAATGEGRHSGHKPQLLALSTDDDQPIDWLRAGQALQRSVLTGTRYSVSARYGDASLFLAELSEREDDVGEPCRWPWQWSYAEQPQMVMQVGYATVAAGRPRPATRWNGERPRPSRQPPREALSGRDPDSPRDLRW